ncbi:hypothetical protein GW835_01835 [archaeon]|nr:hypothetical protein [archaeon]NCP79290.1 hypothetical protein [archaeon]NCP98251.1 hypothetical protein [archaeon]NCQ07057.1 hypothetical protein [archaeon]NCQ50853.1 hypothetical protein [archaeon]
MDRKKRIKKLVSFFKDNDDRLISILFNKTKNDFNQFIEPLIDIYCPEIRKEKFYLKLILGSTELYALGGYIMLLLSGKSYNKYRFFSKKLLVNNFVFIKIIKYTSVNKNLRKQIMYSAVCNVLLDEIYDNDYKELSPRKRSKIIKEALVKKVLNKGKLSLLSYLASNLDKKAVDYGLKWCDAETRCLLGKESNRKAGIFGSMELLYSTISKENQRKNIKLMFELAYFVQMLDDYIDLEDDLKNKVVTPVIEGKWDYKTIIDQFDKCIKIALKISKENNISERYFNLIEKNLRFVAYNLVIKMGNRSAN